jgi:hypothetical protein
MDCASFTTDARTSDNSVTIMLEVRVEGIAVTIGDRFAVSFYRTLRIPDDGEVYPLSPGCRRLPSRGIIDHAEPVPEIVDNGACPITVGGERSSQP